MARQDVFKRFKDNILLDKKIQLYRLHFNYLKVCLKYPKQFDVKKSVYKKWNLKKIKSINFDNWWKSIGMRLLGTELGAIKEIKSKSIQFRPNTTILEIPNEIPMALATQQIKDIIKSKSSKKVGKDDEKNNHIKLEIYLRAWKLRFESNFSLKKIRNELVAHREKILKQRKSRSAMDFTSTEKFLKSNNEKSIQRQIFRYVSKAQKILNNVSLGLFPGNYS